MDHDPAGPVGHGGDRGADRGGDRADRPLRVALLGFGLGGRSFHAPFIDATAGLRLAAVVTADPGRAAAARSAYPGAEILPSADDVWRASERFDVAVVTTPNRTHAALALAAIEAGLAVVVDKPFATSVAEAERVVAAGRAAGIPLTAFHNRRWDGDFRTLQGLLASGALGTVGRFESRFERWRPEPKPGWRERGGLEEAGGLLFDLGSHLIDQALTLFGPARRVYAELDLRRPHVQVDDDVFVALEHASGVRSHLWASALAGRLGPRFRVLGDRAAYVKYGMDVQEESLRADRRPDRPAPAGEPPWGVEPQAAWGTLGVGDHAEPVPTEAGAYQRFYELLVEAVRGGGPVPVDPADAVASLRIIEAARRSAAEHHVIDLP